MSQLSAELEQFVKIEVASGRFPNREAVIDHALRLLQREREEARAGLVAGLEDAASGNMQPLADTFNDLRREFHLG